MSGKFIVNGQEYDSIEDMPAEVRSVYQSMSGLFADADHNGIPDTLEGKGNAAAVVTTSVAVKIIHDGKVYTRASDLPPEVREKYEKAMQKLGGASAPGAPGVAGPPEPTVNIITTGGSAHIIHDGKIFANPADLPPEIRAKYDEAMKLMADTDRNRIPDIPVGVSSVQVATSPGLPSAMTPTPPIEKHDEDGSKMLTIAAVLMIMLAVAVVLLGLMLLSQNR